MKKKLLLLPYFGAKSEHGNMSEPEKGSCIRVDTRTVRGRKEEQCWIKNSNHGTSPGRRFRFHLLERLVLSSLHR